MQVDTTTKLSAFQLKGSVETFTVMHLYTTDISAISAKVHKTIQQVPNFFNGAPVLLDLRAMKESEQAIPFSQLTTLLKHAGFVPVAVRNGTPQQHSDAKENGFGVLTEEKVMASEIEPAPEPKTETIPTKVISGHVRSGQQVYAKGADLIVLGSVSAGAEVLADGNIHIYGTLRGRAFAGGKNNTHACIYTQKLDAELISVAGYYLISDDVPQNLTTENATIQVYLDEEELKVRQI